MVKRLLAVALVLTLVFGFVACEDRNPTPPEDLPDPPNAPVLEDNPLVPDGPPPGAPESPPEPPEAP